MGWSRTNKFPSEAFTPVSAVLPWASMPWTTITSFLYPYCITHRVICQEEISSGNHVFLSTSDLVLCSIAVAGLYLCPSLLTLQIIAHLPLDCNRQNVQNRDFYFLKICATFLLTKLARHGIMEISARAHVSGPKKTATPFHSRSSRVAGTHFNF